MTARTSAHRRGLPRPRHGCGVPTPGLGRSSVLGALLSLAGLAGCGDERAAPTDAPSPPPLVLRYDHLWHLGLDAVVDGRAVRAVALYAEAPDYRLTPSPARDGSEGIAAVDDAARAAIVHLRAFESSRDPRHADEAEALLRFVAAMEQGDGEFLNFIDARGRPNRAAPTSRKSMSYWAARGIWALGEAVRVFGPLEPARLDGLRPPLDRAMARLAREVDAGRLVAGSATATAEALLGLLALHAAEPGRGVSVLAARTAELLLPLSAGSADAPLWGGRPDGPGAGWHAWGARSTAALARAAVALDRPDFLAGARTEADGLWARCLLAAAVPAEVDAEGRATWYPQIAYGIAPIVEGYLALAEATGDRRYGVLAGLAGAWLLGSNPAGVAMYDEETGRTFDGIDGPGSEHVNRNAGAESTIEALLALQAATRNPDAAEHLRYRPAGEPSPSLMQVPDAREFTGPGGASLVIRWPERGAEESGAAAGLELERRRHTEPVTLTYWPAANPVEVRVANRLAERWNRENPDVQVRVQPLPAGRSTEEVLLAAIVGRATPDVSSNVSSALLARLVRAHGVLRLDHLVPTAARLAERASTPMLESLRLPDGGLYAMPWKTNPELLMYNVDRLAGAGLAPPRTHAELLEAFRRLAGDTNGDGRTDRWAMWAPLKPTWYERFYDFYPLYLAGSGGRTLGSNGEIVFDNEAAAAAMRVLRAGFVEGLLPRTNFSVGRDPFVDGVVAMKIIGPWFLYELEQLKPEALRYDVVPVPGPDGADPDDHYTFADLRNIAVFSTTRHPLEVARFVAYLTSPEADRLLIEEASQLPYRRGLASDPRFRSSLRAWPTLPTFARYVERTRDLDLDPDVIEIFDILSEAYESAVVYAVVPVEEALARAAAEARIVVDAR